jgi:glycosyltransferase involved in cell wall biosynthesis
MRSPFQSDKLRSSDVFCIVNPCLKNLVGHYFEYDRSLVAPARQRGYEVVILGHQQAEPAISEMMPLQKSFTRDIWHTYPSLKHLNANVDFFVCNLHFYRELRRALSKISITSNSVVFAHTFTTAQLLAWAWYAWSLPSQTAPQIVLLLRYQPAFYANRCAEWAFRILEHVSKRGRIRLASDSHRLAEQYGRLTFIPVEEFPIPHTEHISLSSEASIAAEGVCKPLRFVSLGDARDEKGFLEILDAITILHRTQKLDRFQFVLQSNRAAPDVQAKIDEFSARNIPNVRLIPEALSSDQYYALLESADVVLLPYWRSIYEARTSGIFAEAVAAGKPVIVSEDTWMSDQLLKFGAGILCRDRDPGDLNRAICEISDNYLPASQFARERRREWSRVHNPDSLVAAVVKPSVEPITPERPRRIAVFYPWGDILERKSGASIRCNLMIDFLKVHAEQIRVLHPGRGPDTRIGNVQFECCGERQLPRKLAQKVFEGVWYILTFGRSRGQDHFLWYHLCHRGDRGFHLRVWDLVSWADIVFLEYTFWSRPVIDVCARRGIKVILTDYDVVAQQVSRSALLHRLTFDAEAGALRKANHAISVSIADQQIFRQAGVETEVIPNPVNIDGSNFALPKHLTIAALEQLYDISLPGKKVCLFVGSLFQPNVVAVDTIRKIAGLVEGMSSGKDICFVVVGGCAAPERNRNFVALGKVDDIVLRALYHIAGLVLIPLPFGTGVSVKTIEAMAAQKPILGTRHAFRGLTVESGRHCIISDDFDAYPRIIGEVFNDPEKQQELAKNASSFSEAYDYRRVYSRYLELMNLPVSESSHGPSKRETSFRDNVIVIAQRALERQNPGIASAALRLLLERDRRDGEAHYLMARNLHQSGGDDQAALEHYDSSLEFNYSPFLVRLYRSRLLRDLKRPEAAEEDLKAALMAAVDNCTAEQLATFKDAIWKSPEAAEDEVVVTLIPPMIAIHPRNGELCYRLANGLHRLGRDPQRAFEHYTRALEFGSDEFLVRLNRSRLLRDHLDRLSESYADAKRAIELKPEDPQARTNYTEVVYRMGTDPAVANLRWPLRLRNWSLRKLRAAMGAYLSIDVLKGHTDEKISALMTHIDQQFTALNGRFDESTRWRSSIDRQLRDAVAQLNDKLDYLQKQFDVRCNEADTLKKAEPVGQLLALIDKNLPVYLGENCTPLVWPKTGNCRYRVIVVSIPKAGTYLLAEILKTLGLEDSGIHVNRNDLSDYRFATIKEAREEYLKYSVNVPLKNSINLIAHGQFVVGHLPYEPDILAMLRDFKVIFVKRDIRDAIISQMRFFSLPGRGRHPNQAWKQLEDGPEKLLAFMDLHGPEFISIYDGMVNWLEDVNACKVSFEDVYGDLGEKRACETIERLVKHLDLNCRGYQFVDYNQLLGKVIGSETKTWSGGRTRREKYWNSAVNDRFDQLGGTAANKKLGYTG